uniref:All-trans-retinol dehydrogenase [NAD(+)] ADH4 n=1 Tax=Rattus norvegicus TaxID=10116 RepID=ADH4_RAT|nr:RecName: Full=All-trans-retinol dehydrogenase [NAD(+)] ADH4; AltName: Full=Alcohol dehydrogenase 2; AltName: Full=Alcohol dehydrogenase 4; AltName: Full=Alcohol dehydrogenase class II; Short=Alcohol dehydrogenase II [Rattus norvegicus]CAA62241.1 alcohol dehydrogenase [Rattus norvegicus]
MGTQGKVITCKAAIAWKTDSPLCIEEIEVSPPKAHEVRIKVIATCVCPTDINATNPKKKALFPVVLGHECAGIVESVGPGVTNFKPGDKVIPFFAPQCKKCKLCLSPLTNLCGKLRNFKYPTIDQELMEDRTSRFTSKERSIYHFMGVSSFSQYTVVSEANLARVDDEANLERVCLIGCGFTSGYGAAINTAKVTPGSACAVFGLGCVGLSAVIGCKIAGASRIIAIDINSEKFPKAKALGATDCLNPRDLDKPVQDVITELTGGGVDFSLDCAGTAQTLKAAVDCTVVGWGSCTVVGAKVDEMNISTVDMILGRSVKGTFFGGWKSVDSVPNLVTDYKNKKFDLDLLVTHALPFDKINDAIDLMNQGKSIRTILTF